MKKLKMISEGKAKTLYTTDDASLLIMEYRNDTSAFDGVKTAKLDKKGMVNNYFNAEIMQFLAKNGIPTHFEKTLSATESLVKALKMVPVECVVRNLAAGSICKRLGLEEGTVLMPPTFEFFYKNDALHDPMINEYHIKTFGWAEEATIERMKALTFEVNQLLKKRFEEAGLLLVDYKLEFGLADGEVYLADEFTPDGCRIWDAKTRKKLDKDRFRQDLGDVIESYEEVATRLGIKIPT